MTDLLPDPAPVDSGTADPGPADPAPVVLRPAVLEPGRTVGPGPAVEVDASRVARFAAALGVADRDDVAPPTMVIALAFDTPGGPVDLIAPLVAGGLVGGVVHGDQQLRLHRPVRVGDRLVFSSTVVTARERGGATIASISTQVRDAVDEDAVPVADLAATFFLTGPAS